MHLVFLLIHLVFLCFWTILQMIALSCLLSVSPLGSLTLTGTGAGETAEHTAEPQDKCATHDPVTASLLTKIHRFQHGSTYIYIYISIIIY